MNGTDTTHLSPETIEDAALGRLPAGEREAVRTHLAGCGLCRKAYEEERVIAAGTRAWGRATMKQRLAGKITEASQRRIPWPHVLGAAALVVVVVGVGIIFRWRDPSPGNELIFADSSLSDANATPYQPAPAPGTAPDRTTAPKQAEAEFRDDFSAGKREQKSHPPDEQPAHIARSLASEKDKEADQQAVAVAAPEESAAGHGAGLDVWLSGSAAGTGLTGGMQSQPAGASQQGISRDRLESARSLLKTTAAPSPAFLIEQRLRRTLENSRGDKESPGIPAHVVRSGDTLRITLFLDSLLTAGQLRSTVARQVTPDSFIIFLPFGTVGYRLPENIAR